MVDKNDELNYISTLHLNRYPFAPEPDLAFYYEYDSLKNCYALLSRLVQGDEIIILVIGEQGSGKTSLLKRYLSASIAGWKTGRIRIRPKARAKRGQPPLFDENKVDSYPAYFLQDVKESIIIIDDAHELSKRHLTYVLKSTQKARDSDNVKRFILLGEPQLMDAVNELTASLGYEIAVSKIFLPPMSREQITGYLNYRLAVAGYIGKRLFSATALKKIHRLSGGLPGRINTMANQQLKENLSGKNQRQKGLWSLIQKYRKALNWSAAGVAALIIAVFVVFYYTGKQSPTSDNLGLAQRVFRSKIELPVAFEKAPLPVSEALSSEKQNADSATLETQTDQVVANLSPEKKTIEIVSKPPEAAAPRAKATSEAESVPQKASVNRTAPGKEHTGGKAIYREEWLLSQNSSYYTIQILGVQDEVLLLKFIENDLTETQTNLAYYRTSRKGKDWYPLLYGVYASKKEASSAIKQLPPHIQKASPWIRSLSSIQSAILKQTKP